LLKYFLKKLLKLSGPWVSESSAVKTFLKYTGAHLCRILYRDWSHRLSSRSYLSRIFFQLDSNISVVSGSLIHTPNSSSKEAYPEYMFANFSLHLSTIKLNAF
jgi:hypothetical protein